MTISRHIARVVTTPAPAPGFMGAGHEAVMVVDPSNFAAQDPFILLMDDRIDLASDAAAGGEHPHAGFETVTFVVEGSWLDHIEGSLETGDVQWMTAGSGVIHNEDVRPQGRTRILQLWLTLPHESRWVPPRFETVTRNAAPVRREPGVEVRVYSGASGDVRSPTENYVPVTLADITLDADAVLEQSLPASYNGFVFVLEGSALVGDTELVKGQVGWLDRPAGSGASVLSFRGGAEGARVMLYAGEPTNTPIAMHGPFVGETRADIVRVSGEFMAGRFPRVSELSTTLSS